LAPQKFWAGYATAACFKAPLIQSCGTVALNNQITKLITTRQKFFSMQKIPSTDNKNLTCW